MLIDIPVIRELAIAASIGVAVLIFTNLVLLPVVLSFTGVSGKAAAAQPEGGEARSARQGSGQLWTFLDRFTTRSWATAAFVVSVALAAGGPVCRSSCRSATSTPARRSCAPNSRYNLDNAYITAHYALSSRRVRGDRQDRRRRLHAVRDPGAGRPSGWELQQLPGVQTTVSLADAVQQITAGTYEGNAKWLTLTRNQDVLELRRAAGVA